MLLTENEQKFSQLIKEELGVTDSTKLDWMARYAAIHQMNEGMQGNFPTFTDGGIYSTPLNTMGMGNPMMPQANQYNQSGLGTGIGNTGADFHDVNYVKGSGDIPMSTLSMALEIAAVTIGFELVAMVPSAGPWAMLSFNDYPYAGGKLGRINETAFDGKGDGADNKPIYIKLNAEIKDYNATKPEGISYAAQGYSKYSLVRNDEFTFTTTNGTAIYNFVGKFMGFSRIDNNIILQVVSAQDGTGVNVSIADVFTNNYLSNVTDNDGIVTFSAPATNQIYLRPELVTSAADHIQGFANFFDGDQDPMTRAQNETGVGNTIGARIFTKMVQMGSFEVTGSVTRQQLQDMPLYGVDVIGGVLEAMQNEISQSINNRILDRVFKLGVTNAETQRKYQNVDLNLYLNGASGSGKNINQFPMYNKYVDIYGHTVENRNIPNAIQNTAAENLTTHQRRIMSRLLAASNLIASVTRRGRGNWAVCNTQILSALQDASAYVVAPMTNTLRQGGEESLYFAGSICGLNLYVDPYMTWDDTRICVGRKAQVSNGKMVNGSGVVFMPYILADTVQTIVEGTMAPKLLCNSRFAIVDAGFYPEQNYLTFMVDAEGGLLI